MKITSLVLDQMVLESEYDIELREGLVLVDELAFKEGISIIEMINKIMDNDVDKNAKQWMREWDKNREIFHNCDQNPYDRRKKIDDWEKRFQKNTRFLAPVWCNVCKVAYRSNSVCGHILRDGFKEGVDSIKFYSDHPQMVQRRNLIKKRVNQSIKTFF